MDRRSKISKASGQSIRGEFEDSGQCQEGRSEDETLESMKSWVASLTKDDFLKALEFSFAQDEENKSGKVGRNDFQAWMANSDSGSHEYDLLKQMVDLQSPPPTPVHPRAVAFKPATKRGATDGRDEEERVRKNRLRRPRLFQLFERFNGQDNSLIDHEMFSYGANNRRQQSKKRGERKRHLPKRFDIIAKKFTDPWGESLSVGCTAEQCAADEVLLLGTTLRSGSAFDCPRCMFHFPESRNGPCSTLSTDGIMRIIRFASRGKFLSKSAKTHRNESLPFCAPWFDPTAQWFSLPMYLASRFEVSLWDAFRRRQQSCNLMGLPALPPCLSILPIEKAMETASDSTLRKAMLRAVCRAAATDLLSETCQIRDQMAWKFFLGPCPLLNEVCCFGCNGIPHLPARVLLLSLFAIPLVEMGSCTDRFRLCVQSHFQNFMALESETELIEHLGSETNVAENCGPVTKQKRKRKKKKKKKRNKSQSCVGNRLCHEDGDARGSESAHTESEPPAHRLGKQLQSTPLVAPDSSVAPPSKARNRHTMIALLVIEQVIENVFQRVGLGQKCQTEIESAKSLQSKSNGVVTKGKNSNMSTQHEEPRRQKKKSVISVKQEDIKPPKSCHVTGSEKDDCPILGSSVPQNRKLGSDGLVNTSTSMISLNDDGQSHQSQHELVFSFLDPRTAAQRDKSFDSNVGSPFFDTACPVGLSLNFGGTFDGWNNMNRYQSREKSLFAEFFSKDTKKDHDEFLIASSTAASIASSSGEEDEESGKVGLSEQDIDEDVLESECKIDDDEFEDEKSARVQASTGASEKLSASTAHCEDETPKAMHSPMSRSASPPLLSLAPAGQNAESSSPTGSQTHSPSPPEPPTPPPQLSPILVSLADLRTLRKSSTPEDLRKKFDVSTSTKALTPAVAGSLPSSPVLLSKNTLTPSWSREDLRISSFQEDQLLRRKARPVTRQADAVLSYRNAAAKSVLRPASTCSYEGRPDGSFKAAKQKHQTITKDSILQTDVHVSTCAQSESALEGRDEVSNGSAAQKASQNDDADNITATKDGATTISSSAPSPPETEEMSILRDERNSYRDMCLTLGAEVAKLKNLVASQMGSTNLPYSMSVRYGSSSYDPEFMPPFFRGFPDASSRDMVAMSDAGVRGDHESTVSEDGTDFVRGTNSITPENPGNSRSGHARNSSLAGTYAGSDNSLDQTSGGQCFVGLNSFRPLPRDSSGPLHGLQSRLAKDIDNFLQAISAQLRKQDSRRAAAMKRIFRLVSAVWPRAQVNLYGSHVSNLCLPSSDLDFVISLPAVHKDDPAEAPGVLEGRNAINETSHKLMARKLKGESWLDPRSLKIIERTVVPVIKVSTKDTRARTLQLDISFDGPEHHGLEAVGMVTEVMEEFPTVRPLVLVLKQFLLDRGLLTAYTGGISSYCLFLMVTRYLQEQASSWGDCGALLMGFLDFYGNSFDPRATGISVRRRQYFSRTNYAHQLAAQNQHALEQQMWHPHAPQTISGSVSTVGGNQDLLRRHSFTEKGNIDGSRGGSSNVGVLNTPPAAKHGMRPPRFQPSRSSSHHNLYPQMEQHQEHHQHHTSVHTSRPYTFDPLFVEDPLTTRNNVGRNSFRIFQVKRAFSDAHRALVASLEWDMQSDLKNESDYPLLKCLLQNEDSFFELEDPR